jgi:hypothetical protein
MVYDRFMPCACLHSHLTCVLTGDLLIYVGWWRNSFNGGTWLGPRVIMGMAWSGCPGHGVKLPHIGALHGAPGAVPQPALPVCFAPSVVSSYSSRVCVVIGKQPVQHGLGSAIAMC